MMLLVLAITIIPKNFLAFTTSQSHTHTTLASYTTVYADRNKVKLDNKEKASKRTEKVYHKTQENARREHGKQKKATPKQIPYYKQRSRKGSNVMLG